MNLKRLVRDSIREEHKLPYRKTISLALKTLCACLLMLLAGMTIHAGETQKLAVVNVSFVFEKYAKVADVQRKIDAVHDAKKKELEIRGRELQDMNKRLTEMYQQAGQSEQVFDMVQSTRKQQFLYERDVAQLNATIQKDYTREMREVLSDIRQAIKGHAEANGYDMVLRSPDSDNPDAKPGNSKTDPAALEKQTYLQKQEAQTLGEVMERFNRNPVLFGATTVDITQDVLNRLNEAFMKRALGAPPAK